VELPGVGAREPEDFRGVVLDFGIMWLLSARERRKKETGAAAVGAP